MDIDELGSITLAFFAGFILASMIMLNGRSEIIIALLGFACGCGFMHSYLKERKIKEVKCNSPSAIPDGRVG